MLIPTQLKPLAKVFKGPARFVARGDEPEDIVIRGYLASIAEGD